MSKPTACGLPATTASTCARRFSASLELAALDQRQIAGIVLVERQLAAAREDLIELDVVAAQRALQGIGTPAAGGAKVEDPHGYPVCCVSSGIGRASCRERVCQYV